MSWLQKKKKKQTSRGSNFSPIQRTEKGTFQLVALLYYGIQQMNKISGTKSSTPNIARDVAPAYTIRISPTQRVASRWPKFEESFVVVLWIFEGIL